MKIDILAISVHPDDAELSCSGTLMLHKKLGYTTGIVDLTQGELGSRGTIETRKAEADEAARILKLDIRTNLKMRDGFFKNDEEHQLKLIQALRTYRPNIVLGNAIKDRHPDHGRAAQLINDACFLSGLSKINTIDEHGNSQAPWRPKKLFHYIQDQYLEPDFVIDITDVWPEKLQSILAYKTQFNSKAEDAEPTTYISQSNYLNVVEYRNVMMGKKIGVRYGEGFIAQNNHIGLKSFDNIILPELV